MRRLIIGVHGSSRGFTPRWKARLSELSIDVVDLDFYADDVVARASACDGVMWHWSHSDPKAVLFARQLLASLEASGIVVFPNHQTGWHFDDKVAQKYLLEAIDAPVVPSHVFYTSKDAESWLRMASYPLVFKLRGGAGAQNVRLVKSYRTARRIVSKAFGGGFPAFDRQELLKERFRRFRRSMSLSTLWLLFRGIARALVPTKVARVKGRERGYCYFQEFMPGNAFDTRIVVVGNRAVAIRRMNREGDFRASGGGLLDYSAGAVDIRCVEIAFEVSRKIGAQSIAFDFVRDTAHQLRIIEISYGFSIEAYDECEGWWDDRLKWNPGGVRLAEWMVDDLISSIRLNRDI